MFECEIFCEMTLRQHMQAVIDCMLTAYASGATVVRVYTSNQVLIDLVHRFSPIWARRSRNGLWRFHDGEY